MELIAPSFVDYAAMLEFRDRLALTDEATVDFSRIGFAYPDGMVLLSRIICDRIEDGASITPANYERETYPINMGFFRAAGLGIDPQGHAPGNENYFPVTKYSSDDLRGRAERYRQNPGEVVNSMAADLSKILTRGKDESAQQTITYSIREIVRNIIEHSGSENFLVSAQYYPWKRMVEIAIMDKGVGIRQGLSSNPHLALNDDYEAILKALVPGISGAHYRGMPERRRTEWSNSGFGLFMTSQICRMGGRFTIGSYDTLVTMTKNSKDRVPFGFAGTLIVMQMNVSSLPRLVGLLKLLTDRGERVARLVKVQADVEASFASKFVMETD